MPGGGARRAALFSYLCPCGAKAARTKPHLRALKYLLLSDIHGSRPALERVLDFYRRERYDMLLLLGDVLNYGPRNGLPAGLDAQGVAALLNPLAGSIVAVRGNCDSEVDQMLLRFPMMGDYAVVVDDGLRLFLTHGHRWDTAHLPPFAFDVFACGHSHLWELGRDAAGHAIVNTGSPTFPKQGRPATFATLENGVLSVRTLDGSVLSSERVGRS